MNAPIKTPGIGDNTRALITADQLGKDFAHVEAFVADLETKSKDVPPVIEDDEDLAIVKEIVPKLRNGAKRCDEVRDEQKRPYLDAGNVVQAFFKALENRLLTVKADLEARGTRYLKKKEDAERTRQAEIAKRQAEEAKKLEAEAMEAAKANRPAEAKVAVEAANAAAASAAIAAQATTAKPAELARTHTTAGTATLVEHWEPRVEDFSKVDLPAIQVFIKPEEIMGALRAHARRYKEELAKGEMQVKGVVFVRADKGRF